MSSIATTPSPRLAFRLPLTRLAGALYLVIIAAGITSEAALRGPLIVPGADLESAGRIAAHLGAFRASIALDLVMMAADVALALVLFALFRPLDATRAQAAMVFRLIQAAVIGASLVLLAGVPALVTSGHHEIALQFVRMHATGYDLGLIFFGVNSLLMMQLLSRTTAPRLLSCGIGAAGVVYIAGGALRVLAPDLSPAFAPAYVVPLLAESGLCLWLLTRVRLTA